LRDEHPAPCIEPLPHDKRFRDKAWQQWPFNFLYQAFLLQQQWWHDATCDIRGMHPHHASLVNFLARQMLDMFSPSNFLPTNPQVLDTTLREGGSNLLRGTNVLVDDMRRMLRGQAPRGTENFSIGKRLAVTPGKVIYRNRLIELIQYAPATGQVKPQPILIVPAWIMKYYILDLQPDDSLVKYMVDRGYTVFMISWKNPGPEERDIGFDDYRRLGVMAALDAVNAIVPGQRVHSVGYCIGGTLLSVAAADMARRNDARLQSMTLFATLTDFSDAGELGLFIDPSQVAYLEDLMWEQGYLGGARMRGVFVFLRPLNLIWSRNVEEYLLGDPREMFDLMAWNADTTNMPYRMHSEYLRRFYLNNDLVQGRFEIDDEPVMLLDIRVPIFTVGTTSDHVAPWKSVYKINRLTRTETTFLLTTGGHNVGVVNPPAGSRYRYQIHTRRPNDKYLSAEAFHERAALHDGSWWPTWEAWLAERSGAPAAPPRFGAPEMGYPVLMDAPGSYVLERAHGTQD
jgi:polyhydroxyalkanoate synthase